ncbi:UDP-N-acetylglucosamine transferase subunit ALG13 homolog [Macadamia integrifolia]|uniref:UDP-N-acetylglucosamine transferase subunit ALG13 homolog n=1 Tax=Macadamia integrifolia TaxID=60698 RepID=UPI001C4EDE28|nr:UDP-N-acetylglucosamine transferase subunit ALG13 homolog [Macadamia integrifolia]
MGMIALHCVPEFSLDEPNISLEENFLTVKFDFLPAPHGRGSSGEDGSLAVDYFTFSPSIADYLRSASLVISHAGSGSIFETLRLRKPLIVVVNEDLMDNHQSELAEELAKRKHLLCARPQMLYPTIADMILDSLVSYPQGDATPVSNIINRFLGFPDD